MMAKKIGGWLRLWISLAVLFWVVFFFSIFWDSYEHGTHISLGDILLGVFIPFAWGAVFWVIGATFRWIRDGFRRDEQ